MSETRQDSQPPNEDLPSELQTNDPRSFVVTLACGDELIFRNDPKQSLVSHTALNSLLSETFFSDNNSQRDGGFKCGDPTCDGTHTQSEVELCDYVNSGRISLRSRPRVVAFTATYVSRGLPSWMQAESGQARPEGPDPTVDPEGDLEEGSKVASGQQSNARDSSTATTQTDARDAVPSSQA